MKHEPPPGEKGGQHRKGRRGGRGQRASKGKRSPFSGLSRDLRARYERISQRDRKAGDRAQLAATGRVVKTSISTGVQDGQVNYEVIEAVEFDAADETAATPVRKPAVQQFADADDEGELADDDAELEADEETEEPAEEAAEESEGGKDEPDEKEADE